MFFQRLLLVLVIIQVAVGCSTVSHGNPNGRRRRSVLVGCESPESDEIVTRAAKEESLFFETALSFIDTKTGSSFKQQFVTKMQDKISGVKGSNSQDTDMDLIAYQEFLSFTGEKLLRVLKQSGSDSTHDALKLQVQAVVDKRAFELNQMLNKYQENQPCYLAEQNILRWWQEFALEFSNY